MSRVFQFVCECVIPVSWLGGIACIFTLPREKVGAKVESPYTCPRPDEIFELWDFINNNCPAIIPLASLALKRDKTRCVLLKADIPGLS